MRRAIVLIGVACPSAQFGRLQAVDTALATMRAWARAQAFDSIRTLSDGDGTPVTADAIYQTVRALIEPGGTGSVGPLDQLWVYFSGHGTFDGKSEFWLLSGAPENPNAAIGLEASFDNALFCDVPHVVFVSDACRTVVKGLQQAAVIGQTIFPAPRRVGFEKGVDIFFAAKRGTAALEVRSRQEQDGAYRAVFTTALCEALRGEVDELVRDGYVRPWPVKRFLRDRVPSLLQAWGAPLTVEQEPDARILSDEHAFLARFAAPVGGPIDTPATVGKPSPAAAGTEQPPWKQAHGGFNARLAERLSLDATDWLDPFADPVSSRRRAGTSAIARVVYRPDPRLRMETPGTGVVVSGGRIARVVAASTPATTDIDDGSAWWPAAERLQAPTALIVLEDGTGALLPLLDWHVCWMVLGDDGIASLSYLPEGRLPEETQTREGRFLRAAADRATGPAAPDLDPVLAGELVERICRPGWLDPILAIEAAYLCRAVGRFDLIQRLHATVLDRAGAGFYDLALLSGALLASPPALAGRLPGLPLLSQGWVHVVSLGGPNPDLPDVALHRTPSLWSLYDATGVGRIEAWLDAAKAAPATQDAQGAST